MRFVFILLIVFTANASWALDDSVLSAKYPGFNDFVSTSLVDLKSYFRNLYRMSDLAISSNGHRHLSVQNKQSREITSIDVLIQRTVTSTKIVEEIHYVLANGSKFDITLLREGNDLVPTRDEDLLLLKFSPTPNLSRFELNIIQFDTKYQLTRTPEKEEAFLKLATFEVNILIETFMAESEVTRNYIFFAPQNDNPEELISVKALMPKDVWGGVTYLHYVPKLGEISPGKFFGGLGGITSMLKQMSQVFLMQLNNRSGFPRL